MILQSNNTITITEKKTQDLPTVPIRAETSIYSTMSTPESTPAASFDALLDFHQTEESLSPYFPLNPDDKDADVETVGKILETSDLRGFGVLIHRKHGLVMLQCSKPKPGKPVPHLQVPGGHVDKFEIEEQQKLQPANPWTPIYEAAKRGCVREIWEETGLDLRESLDRVRPLWLGPTKKNKGLRNEYKDRLFFILELSDSDFLVRSTACLSHFDPRPLFLMLLFIRPISPKHLQMIIMVAVKKALDWWVH